MHSAIFLRNCFFRSGRDFAENKSEILHHTLVGTVRASEVEDAY